MEEIIEQYGELILGGIGAAAIITLAVGAFISGNSFIHDIVVNFMNSVYGG